MGLRQRRWAWKQTQRLRVLLGGKCAKCRKTKKLTFDCKEPRGDYHHKMEWSWRMSFYRAQHREGNLQLLCHNCNSQKSQQDKDLCPF